MSAEAECFQTLKQEMNKYYNKNMDLNRFKTAYPEPGEICAGQRESDRNWYRVRVREVHHRMKGPHV